MKHITKSLLLKILITSVSLMTIGMIVGCTSGLAEPFDLSNMFYEYDTVSGSDGEYILITKHIASQSDIKIPDTIYGIPVREIADSVFADDETIKSVTFGKNMRYIGSNAFGNCKNLQSITFNVSMSDIGEYAFTKCTSLKSVTLPDQLNSVGRGAFYGCKSLEEISVPQSLKKIGGRAFTDTAWLRVLSKEKTVTVGDGILIAYNGDKTEIKLSNNIKCISGAFAGNKFITSVSLKNGITAVGDMAFMGCSSLQEINIPSTVTEIGGNAFYGCTSVKRLVIPENVQSIGADAFTDCSAAIFVKEGSYAEKYCAENGLDCFASK